MYKDPFQIYSSLVKGARNAFDTAKKNTLDFYKKNPKSKSSQHQKSDLKFIDKFEKAIKALEKELNKRDATALGDRIVEFLLFLRKISKDYLLLVKTRFSLEFLKEAPQFLDSPELEKFSAEVLAEQAKNMKRKSA